MVPRPLPPMSRSMRARFPGSTVMDLSWEPKTWAVAVQA